MTGMTNAERGPWLRPGLVARLKDLHSQRLAFRRIAEILSVEYSHEFTRNSIIGKSRRLGLPHCQKPPKVTPKPRKRRTQMRPPKPRVEPSPPIAPVAINGRLSLLDLTDDVCHWPYGDHPNVTYCGEPVFRRLYCSGHCEIAYTTTRERYS